MGDLFDTVQGPIDFPAGEKTILAFWKENNIFQKSLAASAGRPRFVFYEGPPTANGTPHNGHVLTRVIKDLFPRYKTMRGYHVPRKAGWDTHGLPVEVEVEKELDIHGKDAIEAYGVEAFTKKCIASVFKYTDVWERLTERIGFWVDLPEAYVTYHQSYVESVWWALSTLFEKGLLYQGHKIVWWWPQGGTALSAGEVGLGYKTVDDPSVTVRFPVQSMENTSFLAWTTTPWTLPSNCALAVHPDLTYAFVDVTIDDTQETFIVAEPLVAQVFDKRPHTITRTVSGSALVGLSYTPPFAFAPPEGGRAHVVIPATYVTTDSGTGVVHIAPAFGADDFAVAKEHGIGFLCLIQPNGTFDARAGAFTGRFCKEADRDLIRDLKRRGLLFKEETFRHEYPFCWRADTDPLIQYARPAWFIRTTSATREAIANNQEIHWVPDHIRDGRFGDWLKNNVDWALSRERYWGTPLPLWICPSCHQTHAVPSTADILRRNPAAFAAFDAAKAADPSLSDHLKVHKPWIDDVTFPCDACGATTHRVPEVIDCWFDSGCMPFAQWGYPHQGRAEFEASFPADFISEAVDQTRGWFYSLLMVSTLLFPDHPLPHPFKSCIVLGHVTDKHGKKESKSKGNYTPPDAILDTDGADAMRWYFYAANPPWNNTRYSPEAVRLGQQELLIKLRNVYSFFTIYAGIDAFDPRTSPGRPAADRALLDRWILSELHLATADLTTQLDGLHVYDAAQRLIALTDALSNWYVRRSRDRFWAKAGAGTPAAVQDKWDAYHTLYDVLVAISHLIAPFTPFFAETVYQNLVRKVDPAAPESVHMASWPAADPALMDSALSDEMQAVRDVVALGLQARNTNKLKVRQPLAQVEVILGRPTLAERVATYRDLIAEELNVETVLFTQDAHNVTFAMKPDFKKLGPVFGARVQLVKQALAAIDARQARNELVATHALAITLPDGETARLDADCVAVTVTPAEGFAAASGPVGVVILDTTLTDALRDAYRVNELLARIQAWRKERELDYTATITISLLGDPALIAACEAQSERIQQATLADALVLGAALPGDQRTLEIDGLALTLSLSAK